MSSLMRLCRLPVLQGHKLSFVSLRSAATTTAGPPPAQYREGESFATKNARLNRPMSPHLTIYKPQLTSILSISHRGTGIALSAILSAFPIAMMCGDNMYPYYLNEVAQMELGFAIIYAAKFALAFPFMFHTFNGIRHLTWDMGHGFSLRALYKSGYGVVLLSVLFSALIAYL